MMSLFNKVQSADSLLSALCLSYSISLHCPSLSQYFSRSLIVYFFLSLSPSLLLNLFVCNINEFVTHLNF